MEPLEGMQDMEETHTSKLQELLQETFQNTLQESMQESLQDALQYDGLGESEEARKPVDFFCIVCQKSLRFNSQMEKTRHIQQHMKDFK